MRLHGVLVLGLAFVGGAEVGRRSTQAEGPELPPGEGRDVVLAACTGCHATELIVTAHMSRKSWDATLTWMEETQGLAPLSADAREQILDYLEEHQGLEGAVEEDAESPWAYPRYRPNPIW